MMGAIHIKRPEVTADIRPLAELTGLSITDTIAIAVRNQRAIERIKTDAGLCQRREAAEDLLTELRQLPIKGPILSDDDLYDAEGLPK